MSTIHPVLFDGIPLDVVQAPVQTTGISPTAANSCTSTLSSTSTSSGSFCRICHEKDGILIVACKCKGTVAFTHEQCLVSWIKQCGRPTCELCGARYQLRASQERSFGKAFSFEFTHHDIIMILVNIMCVLFLISTTSWLIWSAVSPTNLAQRENDLYKACYALYGFMDLFCLGILVHEIPHMRLLIRRIKLMQYRLQVLPFDHDDVIHTQQEPNTSTSTEPIIFEMA